MVHGIIVHFIAVNMDGRFNCLVNLSVKFHGWFEGDIHAVQLQIKKVDTLYILALEMGF